MNQAINFFWTILCFIPVMGFWVAYGDMLWCYIFIGTSVAGLLLPARLVQLSNSANFYKKTGVKFIRKFVQDGDWINRYIRKGNPQHNLIKGRQNAARYMHTVVMYERYHFFCLVFFVLTAAYAIVQAYYTYAAIITIANIIYNVCPILLQQYNRVRLSKLSR